MWVRYVYEVSAVPVCVFNILGDMRLALCMGVWYPHIGLANIFEYPLKWGT